MTDDTERKYAAAMGQLADQIQASVGAGPGAEGARKFLARRRPRHEADTVQPLSSSQLGCHATEGHYWRSAPQEDEQ